MTALVAAVGLGAQLVLVVLGASVLVEQEPPRLGTRLVSCFTVLSNLLVLVTTAAAAPRRRRRRPALPRAAAGRGRRLTVTGLVHWSFLRPLLHLVGWSYKVDKVLHVAVPPLALVGWLVFVRDPGSPDAWCARAGQPAGLAGRHPRRGRRDLGRRRAAALRPLGPGLVGRPTPSPGTRSGPRTTLVSVQDRLLDPRPEPVEGLDEVAPPPGQARAVR